MYKILDKKKHIMDPIHRRLSHVSTNETTYFPSMVAIFLQPSEVSSSLSFLMTFNGPENIIDVASTFTSSAQLVMGVHIFQVSKKGYFTTLPSLSSMTSWAILVIITVSSNAHQTETVEVNGQRKKWLDRDFLRVEN